jgi:hypothetical protein
MTNAFGAGGHPSDMEDDPAQSAVSHQAGGLPIAPAGTSLHQQRSAALDERERQLDQREAQIARRERADLRDLAPHRYEVDEDLYPGMDD